MSFREKSAWISFILLLLLFGSYVWPVYGVISGQGDEWRLLRYFHNLLIAFAALQIVLHVIVVVQSPKDARTPKDERERLIELKAFRIGFYALVAGTLLLLFMYMHATSAAVAHTGLLAIMLAWLAKLGSQLVYYRRGV